MFPRKAGAPISRGVTGGCGAVCGDCAGRCVCADVGESDGPAIGILCAVSGDDSGVGGAGESFATIREFCLAVTYEYVRPKSAWRRWWGCLRD